MSNFLFYVCHNYHKSVVEGIELKNLKGRFSLTWTDQFLLENLLLDLDLVMFNLNRNFEKNPSFSNLNFDELIKYEKNYLDMEKLVQEQSTNLLHYINLIYDDKPNFLMIAKQSEELTEFKNKIFDKFCENNGNPRTINLFKEYSQSLIFNSEKNKTLEKILTTKFEKIRNYKRDGKLIYDVELMYNANSVLIQIASTNKDMGNIVKANKGAGKFLGYTVQELETSNINIIMPKRIHENHDMYLRNYMQNGKGNVLYLERRLFLRKKDGFLAFISLITKPLFELKENIFKFIGYIQPLNDEYEIIVTDETGIIDGLSKKLGKLLKIRPKLYEKEKIYIQNVCPSLADYYFERGYINKPLHSYSFENYQKSTKNFPILKFYKFKNQASNYRTEISTYMKSLGESIKKGEKGDMSIMDSLSETKCLSKRWDTTRMKIENELSKQDYLLMETKLNVLIPSDQSIELVFFFVKEIDIMEAENLNFDEFQTKIENDNEIDFINGDNSNSNIIKLEIPGLKNNSCQRSDISITEKSVEIENISIMSDEANLEIKINTLDLLKPKYQFKNEININKNSLHTLSPRSPRSPKSFKIKNKMTTSKFVTIHDDPLNQGNKQIMKIIENNSNGSFKIENNATEEEINSNDQKMTNKKNEIINSFKKQAEIQNDFGSEKNSNASVSLISSKKFLRNTINLDYVPKCFFNLKYCLIGSIFVIYFTQILNTILITNSYSEIEHHFNEENEYDFIRPFILRIIKNSYRLTFIDKKIIKNEQIGSLIENIDNDCKELMKKVNYISENYENFGHSSDYNLFSKTYLFEFSSLSQNYIKLIDSLIFFVSKAQGFIFEKTRDLDSENFYFLIVNYNKILEILKELNFYNIKNNEIISSLRINCLILVFTAFFIVIILLILRIKLYIESYNYMNKIFGMLINISNSDLISLKNYLVECIVIFKHEKKIEAGSNIRLRAFFEDKIDNNENIKNFQRKVKYSKKIPVPIKNLLLLNLPLYLLIIGGYVVLLAFSDILNKNLSEKIILKEIINNQDYTVHSQSFIKTLDVASNYNNMKKYFNYTENQLLNEYSSIVSTLTKDAFKVNSGDYKTQILDIYEKENLCEIVFTTNNYKDFNNYYKINSTDYNSCTELMAKALTLGLSGFKSQFYQDLKLIIQILFINDTNSFDNVFYKLEELNLALEIYFLRWRMYEKYFIDSQIDDLNQLIIIVILIASSEFIIFFIMSQLYWKITDLKIKQKLISCRFCFSHFPLEVIMKQTAILKYLQETTNILLK